MTTQWHPLFAQLLRPVVESHYEVQTNVPVGDAPRMADLLLLRRISGQPLPFRGLWKHLTTWNVLEFKGPTVSPRIRDLPLLVELGLGIDRRLNEERTKQNLPLLAAGEVSFWYVANHLGRRFLRDARHLLGFLEPCASGLWRCGILQRTLFLVSSIEVVVESDSLPLHILGKRPRATELAVARLVLEQPGLWRLYQPLLANFHREVWEEVTIMAKGSGKTMKPNFDPLVEILGMKEVLRMLGPKRVLEELGAKRVLDEMGPDWLVSHLTQAQKRELKRLLE